MASRTRTAGHGRGEATGQGGRVRSEEGNAESSLS